MASAIKNLMQVTGMGRNVATAFLNRCDEKELAMIQAGDVKAALDIQANRPTVPMKSPGRFVPLAISKPLLAGEPAVSPSEAVSEAAVGHDQSSTQ